MTIYEIATNKGFTKLKKISLFKLHFPSEFEQISIFAKTPDQIISCFKYQIFKQPVCLLDGCENLIPFTKAHTFSKGCCLQHSQQITFLEKYGMTNPMHCEIVRQKSKDSCLQKYGVTNYSKTTQFQNHMKEHNFFQTEERIKKIKNTNIRKFGVENPMQNMDIAQKASDTHKRIYTIYHEKCQNTNLIKYGSQNPLQNKIIHQKGVDTRKYTKYYNRILCFPNIRPLFSFEEYHGVDTYMWQCTTCEDIFSFKIEDGHIPICRKCNPISKNLFSKGEKEIAEWLKNNNINIDENNRIILSGKELDIMIPDHNIAIEFNGLFWHSELRGKDRNYHLQKSQQCNAQNIQLIHILDRDWYFKQEIVKSILSSKLGFIGRRIYARKCRIREIDSKSKNTFLNINHLQGDDKSKVKLGLFFDNELVSVMTFGIPRFSNKSYEFELYRFANKLNTIVVGGAQKLWTYFINKYKPTSVITYSEKNWFSGTIYKTLGMTQLTDTPPNPHYFQNGIVDAELYHRLSFQKHKLKDKLRKFNENLTAWENLQINNYDRIWDCGNYVFEWINPENQ